MHGDSTHKQGALEMELSKLQGMWRQTGFQADGDEQATDEVAADALTTINGNRFTVTAPDGKVLIKGTFTLDPEREPKLIDWTDTFGEDAGKTFPAIYTLENDRLVFCATDPKASRPAEFRTQKGQVLRILERVK